MAHHRRGLILARRYTPPDVTTTAPRLLADRIPLEELCKLPTFYLPSVSWKADRVAFYWDKTGRMELHVMDLPLDEGLRKRVLGAFEIGAAAPKPAPLVLDTIRK